MSKLTESRQTLDAKVRSIRATDEVYEKFKGIVDEFANSNEALGSLISTWELQQARAILTTREMDITDFNSHVRALQEAFVHSLELQENTETRVKQEVQNLLTSKDEIITELQERVKNAEDEKKNLEVYCRDAEKSLKAVRDKADADAKLAESEKTALQERLSTAEETIKDKVQTFDLLNDKFQTIAKENERLQQISENTEQVQAQLDTKVKECEELRAARSKEQAQAEIDKERAALDAEKAAQTEIKKLMDELQEVRKERSKLEQDNYNLRLIIAKYERENNSEDEAEEYSDFSDTTENKPKSNNKSNQ